ncbi:hypothetical protein LV82_02264 [Albidovulum inexpectatum]|uniref:Ancillary SecYEG translocon subunit/Cell division coordinator CpoB TPR domain-containing protein n=1 Tax=Albidovulum inexpectatum TaxID=196587 RepID=A0A2S5JEN4_9RHOB|nr:tetratricopeptide repeat protein [Albidovulum inexpectatum]PPB79982.1 hypothetical protein LV82_02264 [Albidovulum inexpectatum]
MSDTDSFIEEVTEEVRRDRLFAFLRKYGWIGITLVVLVVGGAAVNEWQKARARAAAQAFGDAIIDALSAEDPAARAEALEQIPADGPGARAVVELLAADALLQAERRDEALARLNALAADQELPDLYRQLAELKAVILADAQMDPAERKAVLDRLAQPGAPYRALAMEQQALLLVEQGDTAAAIEQFRLVAQEPGASADLRRRANQMILVLGGAPGAA